MHILQFATLLVVTSGFVNLLRMTILLIGSDIYNLKKHLSNEVQKREYEPRVSIVIPAHNEEKTILRAVWSVLESNYSENKREAIVVDDGSKDNTVSLLQENFSTQIQQGYVKVISQENKGKAHALNNGIKNHATGDLVMCLDADSFLAPSALQNATKYFEDKKLKALASNVKIAPSGSILSMVQEAEYIICHQMKRAHTLYNIEYIVGGIGSMFRKSYLKEIDYYDTNTVTEDIDITMKILRAGNKNVSVKFGSDVIAYTQSAQSIKDLIKQRYRWKWGRYQTFLKNKDMFLTTNKNFSKALTWIYLPYALIADIFFLLEPIILSFILYIIASTQDIRTFLSAIVVVTTYMTVNILYEDTISKRKKLKLILLSPVLYFLFYILSFVEYTALIKSLVNMKNLKKTLLSSNNSWQHVKRTTFTHSGV